LAQKEAGPSCLRLTGRLPHQQPLEIAPDLLRYVALQLGHEKPETTQVYYRPARSRVKRSFKKAMERQAD